MKSKIRIYIQSIAVLLVLTLLFSLIFACLYYFNVISTKTFHMVNWIGGVIAFGAGGCILGVGLNKKALFNAFPIIIIIWIPSLLLSGIGIMSILEVLSKSLAYLICCFLLFSKTQKA